jgi:uncharacterized membrane protein
LGAVILQAWKNGARLDAWTERFNVTAGWTLLQLAALTLISIPEGNADWMKSFPGTISRQV